MTELNVQYGAGWSAPAGWLNFDASPSLRLERLPVVGRLIKVNSERFPDDVRFGDIVKGLPLADGSAKAVFASHVLEHLSYNDFWTALHNTYKLLKPDGIFRLIVPDLRSRAQRYLDETATGDPEAASRFMRRAHLGQENRPRGLRGNVRASLGNSSHLWMWDTASMTAALAKAGFVGIRRCALGDCGDDAFKAVEQPGRFVDEELETDEVAIEARRPAAS